MKTSKIGVALIRHGKTPGNLRGAYIGRTDQLLAEEGRTALLVNTYPAVDLVFASPLKRCLETASLIYPQKTPFVQEALQECDFGDFEGKTYEELKDLPQYERWLGSAGTLAFPNGEDGQAFKARCVKGFLAVIEQTKVLGGERIAVVCHGGTIMAILEAFALPKQEFYQWQSKNGQGFVFDYDVSLGKAVAIQKLGELE